ncbi:GNAT family N-acetyltransferase [Halobacteriovorax sp. HLS]|uniref:GNAT family N-acetyltransferase n=1 Tax=Halobacteriovorax sp. HLS TaxID=2234000 RepID=UPI000FDA8D60|nr:GNAT family N-acetyltransferase [Halobacteriovorax sp. HLS]
MKSITAKNGQNFVLRPIQKEDKSRLVQGLSNMSAQSIHHRFLGFKKEFTDKELKYLTELDGKKNFALAVGTLNESNELIGVGVGRYHALSNDPNRAEVAITIIDKFQGLGLGTILMKELIFHAKKNDIQVFEGILENANDAMKSLVKKLDGFKLSRSEDDTLKMVGDLTIY